MIPLKIETLLEGRVVEHDRVEYKTGWNPNDIIHSICAFANDYDNTNGGYIVIGVKEENGILIEPGDIKKLSEALIGYCMNQEIVERTGKNNIALIYTKYSMDAMHQKLEKIYLDTMREK